MGKTVRKVTTVLFISTAIISYSASGHAFTLFADDFETDLSQWTGKSGGSNNGVIVNDPLRPGNNVLTFTALNSAGDIFTLQQFNLVSGQPYQVSFEYLGLGVPGSVSNNLGGFAGLSEDLPGRHLWYYGTSTSSGAQDVLIDDGQWGTYVYDFTAPANFTFGGGTGNLVRLMFEDFSGSGGVAGDVYFDNIRLAEASPEVKTPEPTSTLSLLALGTLGAGSTLLRKKKQVINKAS